MSTTQTRAGNGADAPAHHPEGETRALAVVRDPSEAASLVTQGARIVRDYSALHNRETVVLKQLADIIVRLRSCYVNKDERPDLRGTSQEYKDAVQALYRKADVPPDAKSNMQAAVRYHINQRLREYMREIGCTSKDFEYYRLDPDDQAEKHRRREREKTVRARSAATFEAEATRGEEGTARQPDLPSLVANAPEDTAATKPGPEDTAAVLLALIGRFRETTGDTEALTSLMRLKQRQRAELREELDALEVAAALVRSHL